MNDNRGLKRKESGERAQLWEIGEEEDEIDPLESKLWPTFEGLRFGFRFRSCSRFRTMKLLWIVWSRGQPRRHLLTTGWSIFVSSKKLIAGDAFIFLRGEYGELQVGVRKLMRQQNNMSSSVISSHSMHIGLLGLLATASHAISTGTLFSIFYWPSYVWESTADGAFAFSVDTWNEPLGHGIEIKLHLREGAGEYLEESKLKPYGFDVGQSEKGNVLKGLDLGVEGMRVGGQRLLIVPPQLAYGSKGVEEIPPNATIELDVELLAIKQSPFAYVTWVLRSAFSIHHSGTLSASI
ncbi:hypothetical protein Vadar_031164 [Vaccinium darrowii]|uniref:Uncharacterized protein n=1 Tax=Vaccinium darrowii TaxID=229202 RepID=A0ACB7XV11_9ERIC|nr:hypothetical protein Vadar_031164 [Vaccinium darrowii]